MKKTFLSFDMGIRNLSVCLVTFQTTEKQPLDIVIHQWEILDIIEMNNTVIKNCNKLPIQRGTVMLSRALETFYEEKLKLKSLDLIDRVLVEQQPVGYHRRSNTLMKVLSHVLQAFFVMKGHTVTFVSPKQKNKLSSEQAIRDNVSKMKTKDRYVWHKKQAALRAQELVQQYQPQYLDMYNSLKKKDDYADSLLNALCYFTK